MTDTCNICGRPCSAVSWIHVECYEKIVSQRDALLAACYTALHFTANIDPWWEPSHQQTVATLRAAIAKARAHDAGD